MYGRHWNLAERPFGGRAEARYYFAAPTHDEALARLDYLVASRRRLGLLTGGSGMGKSMLLDVLHRELARRRAEVARFSLLGADADELLWTIAAAWGACPERCHSTAQQWRRLADRVSALGYENRHAVALADDVQGASRDALIALARMMRLGESAGWPVCVVLAGCEPSASRLHTTLAEPIELRVALEPWDLETTSAYIEQALARAGRAQRAFSREAIERLHELSGGVPRRINHLADLSLLAAAGQELRLVDEHTIEQVDAELAWQTAE